MISLIALIKKRWKAHKEDCDPDGFAMCPIEQQMQTRVAPEGEWLGTREGRIEALKDQLYMDAHTSCDFCSLCNELITILRKRGV